MSRFEKSFAVPALLSICALVGCQEDERACYDRITADFQREADLASRSGNHAYAIKALESDVQALLIFHDVDRSICDYVTAGPYLERK